MADLKAAIANFERNIQAQTGRSIPEWIEVVRLQDLARHGQVVAWLKSEQSLSHSHANHIAKRALEAATPQPSDDPIKNLFAGGKEGLCSICQRLVDQVGRFGPDVEFAPKKANISLRRRKQFALIQPSTKTRLDLGLILTRPPAGRLEPAGSFNAMFTHRVKLATVEDADDEVLSWLREAYDAAI